MPGTVGFLTSLRGFPYRKLPRGTGFRGIAVRRPRGYPRGLRFPHGTTPPGRGMTQRTTPMRLPRRAFLRTALGATALPPLARSALADEDRGPTQERLREVAGAPVLRVEGLERPVIID